jgi:hypothetical protein
LRGLDGAFVQERLELAGPRAEIVQIIIVWAQSDESAHDLMICRTFDFGTDPT